jgi:hypothetical protein
LNAGTKYALVLAADNTTLEFTGAPILRASLGTMYDGTPAYGTSALSFPIPATLPAWTAAYATSSLALRA